MCVLSFASFAAGLISSPSPSVCASPSLPSLISARYSRPGTKQPWRNRSRSTSCRSRRPLRILCDARHSRRPWCLRPYHRVAVRCAQRVALRTHIRCLASRGMRHQPRSSRLTGDLLCAAIRTSTKHLTRRRPLRVLPTPMLCSLTPRAGENTTGARTHPDPPPHLPTTTTTRLLQTTTTPSPPSAESFSSSSYSNQK